LLKKQETQQDDFEYNDGLGDLLRDKERHEFSWPKTIVVVGLIVVLVTCLFYLAFKLSVTFFVDEQLDEKQIEEKLGLTELLKEDKPEIVKKKITDKEKVTILHEKDASVIKKIPKTKSFEVTRKATKEEIKSLETIPVITKKVMKDKSSLDAVVTLEKKGHKIVVYRVIAGVYKEKSNVQYLKSKLGQKNIESFVWQNPTKKGVTYLIQAGAFTTRKLADQRVAQLRSLGIKDAYIVTK
jgi:hypothetical protein